MIRPGLLRQQLAIDVAFSEIACDMGRQRQMPGQLYEFLRQMACISERDSRRQARHLLLGARHVDERRRTHDSVCRPVLVEKEFALIVAKDDRDVGVTGGIK